MEIKNFRQAKENTLSQREAQLRQFEVERQGRMLTGAIVSRDVAELCVLPSVDSVTLS